MTATVLASVAGILLSLAFSYVPGLNTKYAKLSKEYKQVIMLGLLVVVAGAAYGLGCVGWFNTGVTCDKAGLQQLITALIAAVIANQSTAAISPATPAVREAKRDSKYNSGL